MGSQHVALGTVANKWVVLHHVPSMLQMQNWMVKICQHVFDIATWVGWLFWRQPTKRFVHSSRWGRFQKWPKARLPKSQRMWCGKEKKHLYMAFKPFLTLSPQKKKNSRELAHVGGLQCDRITRHLAKPNWSFCTQKMCVRVSSQLCEFSNVWGYLQKKQPKAMARLGFA